MFCVIIIAMINKNSILSARLNRPHPKHVALTKYFKRHWTSETYQTQDVLYGCNVSAKLGALPPELRARVPREQIVQVTAQFHDCLVQFIADYYDNLMQVKCPSYLVEDNGFVQLKYDSAYKMPDISNLFGTDCVLKGRKISYEGNLRPWRGAMGFVYKLSFPEINADYALKVFYMDSAGMGLLEHGPWFEIPTAFAANKAEPNRNVPVYMASLDGDYYMLSKWAGDEPDKVKQKNKPYVIFHTRFGEKKFENYRNGRRIDFGKTILTFYGSCSYKERKLVRQILAGDVNAVEKHLNGITNKLDYKNLNPLVQKVLEENYLNQATEKYLLGILRSNGR